MPSTQPTGLPWQFSFPAHPSRSLRLGIIGLSPFAQGSHLAAIKTLQARDWPIHVTALCDPDSSRLAAGQQLFPAAKSFSDAKALFNAGLIDAVIILTQPRVSVKLCEQAIGYGKIFFVEKPVSPTSSALFALAGSAKEKIVAAQVGYNRRFQLAAPLMKLALKQNPAFSHVIARMWRADRKESYFYHDTLVHQLDLLLWLLGPLEITSIEATPPRANEILFASLQIGLRTQRQQAVLLDVQPSVGRSLESVEVISPHETHFMSYHSPDGGSEPAEFSTVRDRQPQQRLFVPVVDADAENINTARGFVPQMAAFCRLVTGDDHTSPCSLFEAATCLQLRDDILARVARHDSNFSATDSVSSRE